MAIRIEKQVDLHERDKVKSIVPRVESMALMQVKRCAVAPCVVCVDVHQAQRVAAG
ncbi:hypothetical protein [Paraburkholderia diazotrophica]|uniref:hypothetical protein n=1 Tax=Paraburkholderia diazotrophica TaxID=667676 RepID=UPI0031710A83